MAARPSDCLSTGYTATVHRREQLLLVAWTAIVAVALLSATSWWLQRNDLPNGFQNEADHLYTLTEVYFRLRDNSYSDAQQTLWHEYYPPLNHLLASAGMSTFGRSRAVATLSLGACAAVLLFAVAFLGLRIRGSPTAALAVLLVAGYPAVFGNMRRYEPNIVLTALVALAMMLLIVGPGLRSRRGAVLLGLVAGLGLLCDRVVFAVYLVPVLGVLAWRAWRSAQAQRRAFALHLGLVAGVAALLCGYYYVNFLVGHIDEILTQVGGEVDATGLETSHYSWWSLRGLLYYPLSWLDCQMGPALGMLTMGGLLLYVLRGRRAVAEEQRALLEAWLLGGLVILTLVGKKQPFYSIPLLASAALLASVGWSTLSSRWLRALLAVAILLLATHQLLFLTHHRGLVPSPGRWAWLAGASPFPAQWLDKEVYTQAAAPFEQKLRIDEVVRLCGGALHAERPYTLLFSEGGGAEEGQLMPTLRLGLDTRLVEGVRKSPPEAIEENFVRTSCFVYVAREARHWPTAESVHDTMKSFDEGYGSAGGGLLPDSLVESLIGLQNEARLLGSWMAEAREEVHVYALGAPKGGP